ncbi:MAG: pyridoxamine 5'-phosphate oxidase family protein [Bacteroidetes bacterium]|nr:pyridoxamine 5'-phosphate oxidase family protein [Bacteroidota bacterium]
MNEHFNSFLEENTCASFACLDAQGHPYCFTCFYAVDLKEGLLYFKSSSDSNHAGYLKSNQFVAGTILPDKLNKLQVKGIQFEGTVLEFDDILTKSAGLHYYKTNPMAVAMAGEIWTVQLNRVKYTDSTLGFGKKIIWERAVN